jgi:very-short-patch-repair endonuclease
VAVEADGRPHFTADGRDYDDARTDYLAACGIRVLRFANDVIRDRRDAVLAAIAAALTHPAYPCADPT